MNIVAHDVANLLGAVRFFEQVAAHRGSRNLWYMLVLRDGQDLLLGKATESNAVLKADHANLRRVQRNESVLSTLALDDAWEAAPAKRTTTHKPTQVARCSPPTALDNADSIVRFRTS